MLCIIFIGHSSALLAQDKQSTNSEKGKIYLYWGWNHTKYSNCNIQFEGTDYNFKLDKVKATDRQSPINLKTYLNPKYMTIPQYNFRLGYFFNAHYNVSFGVDHMKYVAIPHQTVNITGEIKNSNTPYNGTYQNEAISLADDFLQFEHTDGLNYINLAVRRSQHIYQYKFLNFHASLGLGAGAIYPRTNTALLNKQRYDQFHVSGYGIDAMAGLNIYFGKHLFIQSELKNAFVNMPYIRTTESISDRAKQHFFALQYNVVFGAAFKLGK